MLSAIGRQVDVREVPPAKRHRLIFDTFDALRPGESFVLVVDHEPKPLLYQLQAEQPGRFEWNVLEAGPETFRVEIARRADGTRSSSECLAADHRRLHAMERQAEELAQSGRIAEARERFAEFRCGLRHHIDMEEKVLFPAFEKATGMTAGPTAVMRSEHVDIRAFLDEAAVALGRGDIDGFHKAARAMKAVLSMHSMREEQILYPTCDRIAGDDRERDDIVRKMQAV